MDDATETTEKITSKQAVDALINISLALNDHEYNAPEEGEYDPIAELRQFIRQRTDFKDAFNEVAHDVHRTAVDKGWWDSKRSNGEAIALMHSELSEALEADRDGNPPDKHCPEHSSMAVEFADVIIRIMDFAHSRGLDVAAAIEAKAAVNRKRPHKHGGKRY